MFDYSYVESLINHSYYIDTYNLLSFSMPDVPRSLLDHPDNECVCEKERETECEREKERDRKR